MAKLEDIQNYKVSSSKLLDLFTHISPANVMKDTNLRIIQMSDGLLPFMDPRESGLLAVDSLYP